MSEDILRYCLKEIPVDHILQSPYLAAS